jgi:hypothetical protein
VASPGPLTFVNGVRVHETAVKTVLPVRIQVFC